MQHLVILLTYFLAGIFITSSIVAFPFRPKEMLTFD